MFSLKRWSSGVNCPPSESAYRPQLGRPFNPRVASISSPQVIVSVRNSHDDSYIKAFSMHASFRLKLQQGTPCSRSVLQGRRQCRLVIVGAGGKKNPEHLRRNKPKSGRNGGRGHGRGEVSIGGAGRGSGRGGPAAKKPARKPAKKPERRNEFVTRPITVNEEGVLQPSAPALEPWWSTLCGHMAGVWCGKYCSFNLNTGKLEPVTLDENKIKHSELYTRVIEEARGLPAGLGTHARGTECILPPVGHARWAGSLAWPTVGTSHQLQLLVGRTVKDHVGAVHLWPLCRLET
jgi:hypothetical protein